MDIEYGVMVNPKAGKGYKQLAPLHKLSRSRLYEDIMSFNMTNHVDEIKPTILKLINEYGVKFIFVFGGDGTAQKIVNIVIYEFLRGRIKYIPKIILLGGGTQKAIFQWLGWRKEKPEDIFQRVVQSPFEQLPLRKLRPLQITFTNADKNREETHYGFIFIMGAINRVIELYDSEGKSFLNGLKHVGLGAIASLIKVPRKHAKLIHQFKAKMSANNLLLPQNNPLSVVCSVTESLLFGIEPFVGRAESNQFYALCYSIPPWALSPLIPVTVRGSYVPPGDLFLNRPVFTFELTPEDERTFFIDGEFYNAEPGSPISIKLGPEIEMVSYF